MGLSITLVETRPVEVFEANCTHNLTTMARAAGCYQAIWRPEEVGITRACQMIQPLTQSLDRLKQTPESFAIHAPANGWGTYESFVEFVERYLAACLQNPDAAINAYR